MRAPFSRSHLLWIVPGVIAAALTAAWLFDLEELVAQRNVRGASLDQKLLHQWQRYADARTALADRVREGGTIGRREWEALLRPTGEHRWNPADLAQLRTAQRARIEARAREAAAASTIDLKEVRRSGRVQKFCELLPKGGMLHVHPTGTLHPVTVERLLVAGNPAVGRKHLGYAKGFSRSELSFLSKYAGDVRYRELRAEDQVRFRALFVLPEGTSDFRRFTAVFPLVSALRSIPELDAWQKISDDFFQRAQTQRVRYVEFTMNVEPSADALRELEETAIRAHDHFGVTLRINAAFDRSAPRRENESRLRRLAEFLNGRPAPVVTGIDLSGDEIKHPALESAQALYAAALADPQLTARFRRTMHAGAGDPRNMRDAILLGAERVGHGTQAWKDPVALEFAANQKLPIEANLVSNVRLGYAASFRAHAFLDLLRLGLRVSLSTDDEGILVTDITNEFVAAITHTNITYSEVRQLVLNSIDTAFVDDAEKGRLRGQVEQDLREFEASWRAAASDAPSRQL